MRVVAAGPFRLDRVDGGHARPEQAPTRAVTWFVVVALVAIVTTFGRVDLVPPEPVLLLVVAAALCAAELGRRRAPSLAWLASIGGAWAATSLPISQARVAAPVETGFVIWLGWAAVAGGCAVGTLWIARSWATRPGRRLDPIAVPVATILFGWLIIALLTTIVLVAAGERADPAFTWVDVATLPIATFSPFVAVLLALGVAADLRAAVERARNHADRPRAGTSWAENTWTLAAATIRELVPGQAAADEATLAAERTRLAGDLHATVLPGLRRAIAEAESGGDPDTLAQRLRAVDRDLERVMADRWPVVLDAFGLVAALEELAEQVEADDALHVEIDVERNGERPAVAIERAAWRVAQLAVDNAIRHAAATTITISVTVDPARVALAVADDGRGFDPARNASARPAGRGLADADRRAAAVGARVTVDARPGLGTRVAFDWPTRG